jgi:hypothetical protein
VPHGNIVVSVNRYGRKNYVLRWTDPVTGRRVAKSACTANKKCARKKAKLLQELLRQGNARCSSESVYDGESASVCEAIASVGEAIRYAGRWLGNGEASTPFGALEAHGMAILEASENISASIRYLAEAIREEHGDEGRRPE